MCQQLHSSIPSLDTVKKFVLPGFVAPEKVSIVHANYYGFQLLLSSIHQEGFHSTWTFHQQFCGNAWLIQELERYWHVFLLYMTTRYGAVLARFYVIWCLRKILNRELFHARRWHSDFQAPMIVHNSRHIYVSDFIYFQHRNLGPTVGKVLKFFQKVCL